MSNFERRLRQSPNYIHARIKPKEPAPIPIREERHPMADVDPRVWGLSYFEMARIAFADRVVTQLEDWAREQSKISPNGE